jgi:hypothetical protein
MAHRDPTERYAMRRRHRRVELRLIAAGLVLIALTPTLAHAMPRHRLT